MELLPKRVEANDGSHHSMMGKTSKTKPHCSEGSREPPATRHGRTFATLHPGVVQPATGGVVLGSSSGCHWIRQKGHRARPRRSRWGRSEDPKQLLELKDVRVFLFWTLGLERRKHQERSLKLARKRFGLVTLSSQCEGRVFFFLGPFPRVTFI